MTHTHTPVPATPAGTPLPRTPTAYPSAFGALPDPDGVRFRTFAPDDRIRLHVLTGAAAGTYEPARHEEGIAEFHVGRAAAGDRYAYALDGGDHRPDPASRFQPEGVHGPSEIVAPDGYAWRDASWRGREATQLVIYELHVGTFSPAGTFAGVQEQLPALRELGVTAIELMPLADFAGARNWGYDGVSLFAPSRNYGRPDDLRALVDAAHALGMAVILDVVYNHLGPEGAYLPQFNPRYITDKHETPWGGAINLDAPGSHAVRGFIIDNALHWIREYHLDGLRLDATHALIDDSPRHLVAELVDAVRGAAGWPVAVYGEDHRNLCTLIEPGGWNLDGVWADDFHHIVRRHLAGDRHSYYGDFAGTIDEAVRTLRQGWLYTGQQSEHMKHARGTDPSAVPMRKFVVCLQNHDQVGNRATGDRLHHQIDAAAWRAASVLLLTAPTTPLLFMGQEWAATSPFLYFTDLEPELGRLVTEGRRREFKDFPEFADPASRERIPDPQAAATFERSRLKWDERATGVHAGTLALYRELLQLRAAHPALHASESSAGDARALDAGALLVRRTGSGADFLVVVRLSGSGEVAFDNPRADATPDVVLTSEDARFGGEPTTLVVSARGRQTAIGFTRPGAVIFRVQ